MQACFFAENPASGTRSQSSFLELGVLLSVPHLPLVRARHRSLRVFSVLNFLPTKGRFPVENNRFTRSLVCRMSGPLLDKNTS